MVRCIHVWPFLSDLEVVRMNSGCSECLLGSEVWLFCGNGITWIVLISLWTILAVLFRSLHVVQHASGVCRVAIVP